MLQKDLAAIVAAINAVDLSTPNEGGDIRAAKKALSKIDLSPFCGAKAKFTDSDGKEYESVIADAKIEWISLTEINDSRPANGLSLFVRGRVQYNPGHSAFRSGTVWPQVTSNRVARQAVFTIIFDDGDVPVVHPVCPPAQAKAQDAGVELPGRPRKLPKQQ